MIRILCFLSFLLCALTLAPQAYAQYEEKDAFYFMKDDNEFSPEEMDEEAMFIYDRCQKNSTHSVYFDCACIAGAFRQEREKVNYGRSQADIYNSLLTDENRGCTNTTQIAGESYQFCTEYARYYREREKNNEQLCECVAKTVAKEFAKKPYMGLRHIENLRSDAIISCDPS